MGAEHATLIERIDEVIANLYRSGLAVRAGNYRGWALRQLRRVIPFDGALWGAGSMQRARFHTVVTVGLPDDFPEALERTSAINPILPHLMAALDTPIDMESVIDDEAFFQTPIYRDCFARYGITRLLSTAHANERSGLYSLVTLYRKSRDAHFTAAEKAAQQRLAYHLFQAHAHHWFLHLKRTFVGERAPGGAAAIVDGQRMYYEVQSRFLDLIEAHVPGGGGHRLPFEVPEPGEVLRIDGLCVKAEPLGDLHCVMIWPAGPLDTLTAREREVVYAVTQGLSFKQAARRIGVAPSTVANHLYRVYRKLGVHGRTELAALVYPHKDEPGT